MNVIFDPSLVLYLPLAELDGDVIMSREAYGHACSATGAAWNLNGRCLDGVDDYLNVAHHECLNPTTGATVEAWVNLRESAPASGAYILSKGYFNSPSDNGEYLLLFYPNTEIIADFRGDSINNLGEGTPSFAVSLNTWNHIAAVFLGSTYIRILVNGNKVLEDTSGIPATLKNTGGPLNIGRLQRAPANSYLPGTIGEIRIYSRALTPGEVQHNYLATKWRYR